MTSRRQYVPLPKPVTSEYTVPSGTVCIQVLIPDSLAHLALLQGFCAVLTDSNNWDGEEADRAALAASWQAAYVTTDWEGCVDADRIGLLNQVTLFQRFSTAYIGGGLTVVNASTTPFNYFMQHSPTAIGDSSYQNCYLPAGDYTAKMLCEKRNNAGKALVFLANENTSYQETVFNEVDMYNSTTLAAQILTATFTLDEDVNRCYWQCISKNASSSNYGQFITCTVFEKVIP